MGCSDAADRPAPAAAPGSTQSADPAQAAPAGSGADPAASPAAPVADGRSPEELAASGRGVYNANCIACHAMDPRQDGALGPAVAGSSRELLEARVLRAEYPAGYAPKRETRVMVPLPHLESKLPELAAYLDSLQ